MFETASSGPRNGGNTRPGALRVRDQGRADAVRQGFPTLKKPLRKNYGPPLFDPEGARGPVVSDGGAAFLLISDDGDPGVRLRWLGEGDNDGAVALVDRFAGVTPHYDAVVVGIPAGHDLAKDPAYARLGQLLPSASIVAYRDRLGQHASIGATAAAIAGRAVAVGTLPFTGAPIALPHRRLLLLEFGPRLAAIEVFA